VAGRLAHAAFGPGHEIAPDEEPDRPADILAEGTAGDPGDPAGSG
jgi:hypothetical protein